MRMNAIKNKFAARKMQHFEQQGRLNISNQWSFILKNSYEQV
jgi:hypothetical protein